MTRHPRPSRVPALWVTVAVLAAGCGNGSPPPQPPDRSEHRPSASAPAAAGPSGSPSPDPAGSRRPSPALQQRLDERLRAAAWADDVAGARRLIQRGADVNAQDGTGQSAYLIATSEGYDDLLRLTLARGADVTALDSYAGTGLIRAAERGHASTVGLLVQAGTDGDHVNRLGYQALHEAIWLGRDTSTYRTTVRVLTASGVQLDRPSTKEGLTPRQMAARRGHTTLARTLAAITEADVKNPDSALLAAARSNDADLAAAAVRAGADLETTDERSRTPLLVAATHDSVEVAQVLTALGADVNALDAQHDTAWLVTGVTGSVEMGEVLLGAGADLTIRNRFGGLSPIPASERGHVAYVRWVVGTGVDLDHRNDLGWTALLEAIVLGDGSERYQQIVTVLLEAGADPTISDHQGRDARTLAAEHGFRDLVRILDQHR